MIPISRAAGCGSEKGQALLIVVLVVVVALTVGLSLASRSIINLRNGTDESNSQKAFSAAEAGVERALKTGQPITGVDLGNNALISGVTISTINGDEFLINNGNPVFQDDGADIWLSPHTDNTLQLFQTPWTGTLNVYWGTATDPCQEPAMQILVISGSRTNPTVSKYAFDTCSTRRSSNSFSASYASGSFPVNGVNGSKTFNYRVQLTVTNGLLGRVTPLYFAGSVGIKGSGLPVQGKLITSTGTSGAAGQQVVRKVNFFQGFDGLPSEFYYSLFTPR